MYQSRSNSICRLATTPTIIPETIPTPEPVQVLEETIIATDNLVPENVGVPVESSYTTINRLDTLNVLTRQNFELFKRMYSAIEQISNTQNHLSNLVVELLKKQDTTHEMLHEMASKKKEEPCTNPLPELKKSFSSQLLKPKKKTP